MEEKKIMDQQVAVDEQENLKTQEASEEICPEAGEAEFSGGEENLNPEDPTDATEPEVEVVEDEKAPQAVALEEEKKNLLDRLARLQAEFDNFRRRVAQEKLDLRARANENLFTELLPIIDNFERAIGTGEGDNENYSKGIEMIYRQILNLFEKEGIQPIEAEGEFFDPNLHHAVMKESQEGVEEDTIIQVLQKGYFYKDRVLRPAMVKVAE